MSVLSVFLASLVVSQCGAIYESNNRGGLASWIPARGPVRLVETLQRRPVLDPEYQGLAATKPLPSGKIVGSMDLGGTISVAKALADAEIGPVLCQLYGGRTGPIPAGEPLDYARLVLKRFEESVGMGPGLFALIAITHAEAFLPGRPNLADWLLTLSQPPTSGMMQWMPSSDVTPLNQAGDSVAPLMQEVFVKEDLAWRLFNETLSKFSHGKYNRDPSGAGQIALVPQLRRQLRWAMSAVLPRRWSIALPIQINGQHSTDPHRSDATIPQSETRWPATAASHASNRLWASVPLSPPSTWQHSRTSGQRNDDSSNEVEMLPVLSLGLLRHPSRVLLGPVIVPVLDVAGFGWQNTLAQTQPNVPANGVSHCGKDIPSSAVAAEAVLAPSSRANGRMAVTSLGSASHVVDPTSRHSIGKAVNNQAILSQYPSWQRLELANGTHVAVPQALVGLRVGATSVTPGPSTMLIRPAVRLAARSTGTKQAPPQTDEVAACQDQLHDRRWTDVATTDCAASTRDAAEQLCEGEVSQEWTDYAGTRWWNQDSNFHAWGDAVPERAGGACAMDIAETAGVPPGIPADAMSPDLVLSSSDTVYELPGGDAASVASRFGRNGGHGFSSDCAVLTLQIPDAKPGMTTTAMAARALMVAAGHLDASEAIYQNTTEQPSRVVAVLTRVGQDLPGPLRRAARLLTAWKCSSQTDDFSPHGLPLPADAGIEPICLASERAGLVLLRDAISKHLARLRAAWGAAVEAGAFPQYDQRATAEAADLKKINQVDGMLANANARGKALLATVSSSTRTSMHLLLSARRALLAALQQVMLEWVRNMPAPTGV